MIKQKTMSYPLILFFWPTSEKWPAAHLRVALPRPSSVCSALGPWASRRGPRLSTQRATLAPPRAQAATWAWAGNSSPRLGLIQPGKSWPFILMGRPCVTSAGSKPRPSVAHPQTLAHFVLPFSPSALLTPPASRRKGARCTGARKEAYGGRGWRRREALRRCTRAAARGPVEWPCDRRPFGSSSRTREHKTAAARLPDLDRRRARIGDRQRRRASFSPRDGGCDGDERTR